jgi:SET domain-containing protein
MTQHSSGYVSPKVEARLLSDGVSFGVYATEFIPKGELILVWGGSIYTQEQFDQLNEKISSLSVQVNEGLYLVPEKVGTADYVNHSCNPNAGLSDSISLVAMRDIEPGEQVCFDYAMTDSTPYDEFECQCGAPNCRGYITGNDWQIPELQERYNGYFSPYLQKRIDGLRAQKQKLRQNGRKDF